MAVIPMFSTTLDLTSYDGLKNAVAAYINRADLTGQIPAFIQQHEAKMNRELRVRDMLTRVQASSDGQFVDMPDDFLGEYSMRLSDLDGSQLPAMNPLQYVGEYEAATYRARNMQGPPRYYTITDGVFELIPLAPVPLTLLMTYYTKIPALTSSNQTNWLLEKSPDLYLVGSCLEAQIYLKDDARLGTWGQIRGGIMTNMDLESERAKRPESYLVARKRAF